VKNLQIMDISGKTVFGEKFPETDFHEMNLSDLNLSGIYVVKVLGAGYIYTQKLIVY